MRRIILIALLTAMASRLAWDEYYRVIITRNYHALWQYEQQTEKMYNDLAQMHYAAMQATNKTMEIMDKDWLRCRDEEDSWHMRPDDNPWREALKRLNKRCCGRESDCTKQELDACSCRDGFREYCGELGQ